MRPVRLAVLVAALLLAPVGLLACVGQEKGAGGVTISEIGGGTSTTIPAATTTEVESGTGTTPPPATSGGGAGSGGGSSGGTAPTLEPTQTSLETRDGAGDNETGGGSGGDQPLLQRIAGTYSLESWSVGPEGDYLGLIVNTGNLTVLPDGTMKWVLEARGVRSTSPAPQLRATGRGKLLEDSLTIDHAPGGDLHYLDPGLGQTTVEQDEALFGAKPSYGEPVPQGNPFRLNVGENQRGVTLEMFNSRMSYRWTR